MRKTSKSSTLHLSPSFIQSHLAQGLGSYAESDIPEFYKQFLDITNEIFAEVNSFQVLEENGKKFAVYNISVTTSFMSYNVLRRYSQFFALREKLQKNFQELGILNIPFPEKKLFGNLHEETLKLRMLCLDEFIKSLSSKNDLFALIDFWEFLDLRVRYCLEMRKLAACPQEKIPTKTKSEEAYVLFGFIEQLNKEPLEITNTLKEIDKFYSTRRPRLGADMAKTLLLGAGKIRGLLHFCGKIERETNTHLSCSFGLPLLLSLMSFDSNKEADIFQELFGSCKLEYIRDLNLEHHLVGGSQKRCKQPALQLIDIYTNKNPATDLNQLFSTPQAHQEYMKWKFPRQNNSRKNEHFIISEGSSPISLKPKSNSEIIFPYKPPQGINFMNAITYYSQYAQESGETSSSSAQSSKAKTETSLGKSKNEQFPWTEFTTREGNLFQIKHQNYKTLNFQIIVKGEPETCVPYFTERQSWMQNFHSISFKRSEDNDCFEKNIKFKCNDTENHYVSFFSRVYIKEDGNGGIVIVEKAQNQTAKELENFEVAGSRNCRVTITPIKDNADEFCTKIKIVIKNLDDISVRFSMNDWFADIQKFEESLYYLKQLIERNSSS